MPRSPMSSRNGWSGKAWSSDRVSTVTSVAASGKEWRAPCAAWVSFWHLVSRQVRPGRRARNPLLYATWARSTSAGGSSRSPASRSRRSCSHPAAYPRFLMWHGGGLTGVTYETTPDGREGWLTYFIRKGWDTYISDAVERGRAGWTDTFKGDALSLPLGDPWERFRIGPPDRKSVV